LEDNYVRGHRVIQPDLAQCNPDACLSDTSEILRCNLAVGRVVHRKRFSKMCQNVGNLASFTFYFS
jgi:hypothetical protein